jgi:hypothetical protein
MTEDVQKRPGASRSAWLAHVVRVPRKLLKCPKPAFGGGLAILDLVHPDYGWEQRCDGCGLTRRVRILKEEGILSADDVERLPKMPCPACDGTSWTTSEVDPDRP